MRHIENKKNMADLNPTIALKVNGLNTLVKRHRLLDCIKNQDLTMCHLQEMLFRFKDTNRLKIEGWKKI